jgi:hypothetical protein
MSGLGDSPLGEFPLGFGAPDAATVYTPAENKGACWLDPYTGDRVVDASTGQFIQTTAALAALMLRLPARRGSSSTLRNWGAGFPDEISDTYEAEAKAEILDQMKDDIAAGVLTIETVKTVRELITGGRVTVQVDYVDLATRTRGSVNV